MADKGHVKANFRYGKILYEGEGAKINIKESLKYFKFAADNGNKKAMFYFGKITYEKVMEPNYQVKVFFTFRNQQILGELMQLICDKWH